MDELEAYVEGLFRKHKNTKQIAELKEEMLGNLRARRDDLIREGLTEPEATAQACRSITSINGLIDGNRVIDSTGYKTECAEWMLIYLLAAWILSIPARIVGFGGQSVITFFLILLTGGSYFYLRYKQKNSAAPVQKICNKNVQRKRKLLLWCMWIFLILVISGMVTVSFFGSDLWFGRHIRIDGPYQFARIAFAYFLPFLSIGIPLCYTTCCHITDKYEVGEKDE